MGDLGTGGTGGEGKFERMTRGPFFAFAKPYLDLIDKGKLFHLVYVVMAGISVLLPFVVMYQAAESGFFRRGAKYTAAFIFAWLVIAFACWIGFQLWLDRRKHVVALAAADFFVTQVFADLIQTFGEWLGTLTGIIGAGVGLIVSIVLGNDVYYFFRMIGMGFLDFGPAVIIAGPVMGFFIIILSRFIAEQLRLFASLVNNTGEIADHLKSKQIKLFSSLAYSAKEIADNLKANVKGGPQ